ncbi:MAG: SIR2 family protein [Acidimicrobiales bacterium]
MGDVAVLLGAGASHDAGLPTTGEMTTTLLRHFQNSGYPDTERVLNFVVGQLLGQEGAENRDPSAAVDVEKVMTAIELLGSRRTLELAPFVHLWHSTVTEIEVPTHRSPWLARDTLNAIRRGLMSESGDRDFERQLTDFVRAVVGMSAGDGRVFEEAFKDLRAALVEILAKPGDTSYLRPLFELCPSKDGWIAIATLNYDLTVETEARESSVPLDTGIEAWAECGDWRWPDEGVRFLKLHGSIDWRGEPSRDDTLRQYRISVVGPDQRLRSPAVVFGGRNKIRAEGPFLELLAQWERMLQEARTLLVVGYSFRDDHVNEAIRRWLNRNGETRIVVVDPSQAPWQGGETFRSLRNWRSG